MARLSGPQRRRKRALEAAEKSWSKRMKSKTNTTDEFVSKTNRRGRKIKVKNPNYRPPTAKDKSDAKKESELESVLNNKPKGGYKDTSPKPESKEKKKDALKPTKGKGPVASGEEYGKHLKEQQKKYKTTGKGPVKDSKEYGKTVKEHAAKKEADAAAKKKKDMADWIKKTRNSPAQRSGAWKGKEHELYEQHLRHKAWKASRKKKK